MRTIANCDCKTCSNLLDNTAEFENEGQLTHLPDVFGRVRLVEQELDAEFVVLAFDAEVSFVVDQVGDVVPLEELRTQGIAFADHDAGQRGADQHLGTPLIAGKEAFLPIN